MSSSDWAYNRMDGGQTSGESRGVDQVLVFISLWRGRGRESYQSFQILPKAEMTTKPVNDPL